MLPSDATSSPRNLVNRHNTTTEAIDMARSSHAPSRRVSIVSLPESYSETDQIPSQNASSDDSGDDDEVLKADFLQGLSDAASGDDEPNSQLLREATTGSSPGSTHRRTDGESAALLNSVLSSHGHGPAPLPSRSERRTSRGGPKITTPRRVSRPSRADVYDIPPDATPPSAQPGQHGDRVVEEENQQSRRSARTVNKQREEAEVQAVSGDDLAMEDEQDEQPRKRGRPCKQPPTVAPSSQKRVKSGVANTHRPRTKGTSSQESAPSNAEATSSPGAQISGEGATCPPSASNPAKSTSSEGLPQTRVSKTRSQNSDSEESSASGADRTSIEETVGSDTTNGSDEELDSLDGLHKVLNRIWKDKRGLIKVRQQRKANDLVLKRESTRRLIDSCQGFKNELSEKMKSSTELTEPEATKARSTLTDLGTAVKELDLTDEEEIRKFLLQDVYAYVFPSLLRTLCTAVDFYVQFFCEDDQTSLPTPHLEGISNFTAAIISLHNRAKTSKFKVNSELVIVRPTRDYIIAPLKRFHKGLCQILDKQIEQYQHQRAMQRKQRHTERANLRKRQKAVEEDQRRAAADDWRRLHIDRKEAEPDIRCWHHLDWVPIPVANQRRVIRDTDASGEPFDRLDVFDHRKRSGKGTMIAEVAQDLIGVEWTDGECLALMDGLAEYTAMDFSKLKPPMRHKFELRRK